MKPVARNLNISGMVIGSIGIFFGFYYFFSGDLAAAIQVVAILTVGVVGVLAFVRHVVYHREDAQRLGWVTERPDWQYEVGFANLGFGLAGLLVGIGKWAPAAPAAVTLAYGLYLLQAALFHARQSFAGSKFDLVRFLRSGLATLLFSGMMLFFALITLFG